MATSLPPEWQELTSPGGQPYYFNPTTNVTQWERPVMRAPSPDLPPPPPPDDFVEDEEEPPPPPPDSDDELVAPVMEEEEEPAPPPPVPEEEEEEETPPPSAPQATTSSNLDTMDALLASMGGDAGGGSSSASNTVSSGEVEAIKAQLRTVTQERDELRSKNAEMETELLSARNELNRLKEQLAVAKRKLVQLDSGGILGVATTGGAGAAGSSSVANTTTTPASTTTTTASTTAQASTTATAQQSATASTGSAAPSAGVETKKPAPAAEPDYSNAKWAEIRHEQTGRFYYVNKETRASQWNKPDALYIPHGYDPAKLKKKKKKAGSVAKALGDTVEARPQAKRKKLSPDDCARYSMQNFAREYFIKSREGVFKSKKGVDEQISHRSTLLKHALTKACASLKDESLQSFKSIFSFMGERKSSKDPAEHADKLLRQGMEGSSALRTEIYAQLCKQLTGNMNQQPLNLGWTLMSLCCGTFPPAQDFANTLMAFLQRHTGSTHEHVAKHARYSRSALMASMQQGARRVAPSFREIRAAAKLIPQQATVTLPNGSKQPVGVFPQTTVNDVCEALASAFDLPEMSFGLDERVSLMGRLLLEDRPCSDNERILDIIGTWDKLRTEVSKFHKKDSKKKRLSVFYGRSSSKSVPHLLCSNQGSISAVRGIPGTGQAGAANVGVKVELVLRQRVYSRSDVAEVVEEAEGKADSIPLKLLFYQGVQDLEDSIHWCQDDVGARLTALCILGQTAGRKQGENPLRVTDEDMVQFAPAHLRDRYRQKMSSLITQINSQLGHLVKQGLTRVAAQRLFLRELTTLESWGLRVFSVREVDSALVTSARSSGGNLGKGKEPPALDSAPVVLLAIGEERVGFFNEKRQRTRNFLSLSQISEPRLEPDLWAMVEKRKKGKKGGQLGIYSVDGESKSGGGGGDSNGTAFAGSKVFSFVTGTVLQKQTMTFRGRAAGNVVDALATYIDLGNEDSSDSDSSDEE